MGIEVSDGDEIKPDLNSIMPHSKESGFGDENYIHTMDAYAEHWPSEEEWQVPHVARDYPYLQHVKDLSKAWPHLRYLAQWMEVTTSPIKWTQFKKLGPRKDYFLRERATRTKVAVMDFSKDGTTNLVGIIDNSDDLRDQLQKAQPEGVSRLYIVEDLSRNMIEHLGRHLDIDPLFFRDHVNDYWWYNTRDPWVELPDLDVLARDRNFFRLTYVQPRYFRDKISFQKARIQTGKFNVLRRLDDDSEHKALFDSDKAIVALVRSKTSLWIKPHPDDQEGDFTGVLLVDPSITQGNALWKGHRPFWNSPAFSQSKSSYPEPPKERVFDDLIFWIENMQPNDVKDVYRNPKAMIFRMTQIVCSDWNILIRYIMARLGMVEWELERPDFRPDPSNIDASLKKLHTWRRRLPLYKTMIRDTQDKLFGDLMRRSDGSESADCLSKMRKDFDIVAAGLVELYERTEHIATVATAVTSIEESRRAMVQNRALGRLTYLAVIFAPLSFISSFFSMAPELSELTTTIWIYFAVAAPVSIIAFMLVEPSVVKWLRSFLPDPSKKKKN
ncbi:hypothetical protein SCAR479_01237 [Seiridium cardinale]|uniref:Uncharacterized protein n=1 Tax=Seiridium cardinale TaxID=138064 RepID=A0ABR2Y8A0_9PEZI